MMRVDVDFNERDRHGHVVTRVPAELASQLIVGQKVNLYDPPERLWADAVVTRISEETRIAAFDVDWQSFEEAEVSDVLDTHAQWSIGVPPSEGVFRVTSVWVSSVSALRASGFVVTGEVVAGDMHFNIKTGTGTDSLACLEERAAS